MIALVLAAALTVPPQPSDYVTDNAGALSARAAGSIREELRSYHDATGNRVIVYIDKTTGGVPVEDWTVDAAHAWRIGAKGKDNGAILFAFMADRKVRIEVGYGLEGALTDAQADRIIRDQIVPRMRAGDVDGAIRRGVDGMLSAITPSFKTSSSAQAQPQEQSGGNGAAVWIVLGIIALLFIVTLKLANSMGDSGPSGHLAFAGASGSSSGSSSDDDSDSSSNDDDFSDDGGDFGGGGASGSW
jgi:uncharacterized protein